MSRAVREQFRVIEQMSSTFLAVCAAQGVQPPSPPEVADVP